MLRNYITEEEERILIFIIMIGFLGILTLSFRGKILSQKKVQKLNKKTSQNLSVKYDLNKVTFEELASIPEIGPNLALAIITKRDSSLFQNLTDLADIKGVGTNKFKVIKKFFYQFQKMDTDKSNKEKIDINTAEIADIVKIKGISKKKAEKIISLRKKIGGFKSLKRIEEISGIGPKTIKRLESYFYAGELNGK